MDYNATVPLLPCVRDAMVHAMFELGNPSSVHKEGQRARGVIHSARDRVAAICDADPAHVIFTSGATESAFHLLTPHYKTGRSALKISKLYTSAVEHPCVLSGGRFKSEHIEIISVDMNGCIHLGQLQKSLALHDQSEGLPMVALQAANSETGVLQPLSQAIDIAKEYNAVTVVDAVQIIGKIPFSIHHTGADFAFISAHKTGGPTGVGAIISRGETLMPEPLIYGGGQEKGHRAGTENLVGIAGFGASCDRVAKNLLHSKHVMLGKMRDDLEAKMFALAPDIVIHGKDVERIGNTSCFTLPGFKSETLQIAFDMEGIATSSGSACSSGKIGESHVLTSMGADAETGALRVSMGMDTTDQNRMDFMMAFEKINRRRLRHKHRGNTAA